MKFHTPSLAPPKFHSVTDLMYNVTAIRYNVTEPLKYGSWRSPHGDMRPHARPLSHDESTTDGKPPWTIELG